MLYRPDERLGVYGKTCMSTANDNEAVQGGHAKGWVAIENRFMSEDYKNKKKIVNIEGLVGVRIELVR